MKRKTFVNHYTNQYTCPCNIYENERVDQKCEEGLPEEVNVVTKLTSIQTDGTEAIYLLLISKLLLVTAQEVYYHTR